MKQMKLKAEMIYMSPAMLMGCKKKDAIGCIVGHEYITIDVCIYTQENSHWFHISWRFHGEMTYLHLNV